MYAAGGALTGPTVASSTNANKTCAVAITTIFDEDIKNTAGPIVAGNGSSDTNYTVCYRTSLTNWEWARSVMPFKYLAAAAIQYDLNGVMTPAGAGGGGSTRWVNYYMLATNFNGQESIFWIPGRAAFTSLALANGEDFSTFGITAFPAIEAVVIWRFTWDTNGTGLGLCRLAQTPVRVSSNIISSTAAVAGIHNGLAGIQGGTVDELYHLTAAEYAGTGTGNFVRGTSPTLITPALGTPSSGNLSNTTADGTNAVGFRGLPQNPQSAAYTTVLEDAGKEIYHPSTDTTARVWTIASNTNVPYPIGTAISFGNDNLGGVITITIDTDTMRLVGAGTTGSRTLAANGFATAIKNTATSWRITGVGLT